MSEDDLFAQASSRLEEMMLQGTVAVEIKSGYGLTLESELKMLRVARRLGESLPLQVKTTLLAAHALPEEFKDDRDGYLRMITDELLPAVAAEGLADFIDVFCETNYFTVAELERVHSHLLWLGVAAHDAGFDTLFMYTWRDREAVMDILETMSGNRVHYSACLLYTSPSPRDGLLSRMPSSA